MRIEKIEIHQMIDVCADTSCIGEYTNDYGNWYICRCCGEYHHDVADNHVLSASPMFFAPYAGGEEPGTEEYRRYGKQDYERMEKLQNGDWQFVGIQAWAEVSYIISDDKRYPNVLSARRLETFTSGGLWGIESDSGDYIDDEVIPEELSDLREHLARFGVKPTNENWEALTEDLEVTYK